MSDNMSLVQHVNRSKNGLTKMQITVSISTRAGMAELSKRLGISQLAIVRSALAAYLLQHEGHPVIEAPAPEVTQGLVTGQEVAPEETVADGEVTTESPEETVVAPAEAPLADDEVIIVAPVVTTEVPALAPKARKPRTKKEQTK